MIDESVFSTFSKNEASKEVQALRGRAWQSFVEKGLPTRKDEDWKYTSVKPFQENFELPSYEKQGVEFEKALQQAHLVVLHNGYFREDLSSFEGVKITALREAKDVFSYHSELFYRDIKKDVFFDLNEAFTHDGVVIELDSKQALDRPIEIIHLVDGGKFAPTRVLVKAAKLSEAKIFERFLSLGAGASFANSVTEVFQEAGSNIKYYQSQEASFDASHIGVVNFIQNADSHSEYVGTSFGGATTRFNLNARLLGSGASAKLDNLYLTEGKQHVDFCTVIDHAVPNCESSQLCKGILTDTSRAVFNGVIRIRKDAQQTNSAQLNKNLLLSEKAEVDTRPQLQIDADDVKAAHGATIGQLDPEEIFYLQSRGIPREKAIRMLSQGFAEDVLFNVSDKEIQNYLRGLAKTKFEGML